MKSAKLYLLLGLLIAVAMVLAACGGQPAEEPMEEAMEEEAMEEVDTGGAIVADEATPTPVVLEEGSEFSEAPMLAEMVAAGDLPPVEERLPVAEDIMVISGVDGIGEYGGIWHGMTWWQGYGNIAMAIYDPPVRWKRDYTGYEPGLVKEYIVSEDGKTLTWIFREGLKWSDGTPFSTTEDMGYWWELANNDDFKLVTIPWWGFDSDGTAMEVSFPDDKTMVFEWGEPHYIATFIVGQGFWEWQPMERPKHFLSPHDPNYDSSKTYEDLEKVVNGGDWFGNVEGYPCLHAWCPTTVIPGERNVYTRNPYYWKVDAEGNQLPYIDAVDVKLVSDEEVRLLELSQGKYEASFRGTTNPVNIPFLLEQAEAGDYYIHEGSVNGAGAYPGWLLNMNFADSETYPDTWEEIRDLLQNQDFRIGLSHTLDRQRMVDVVWDGIGYPSNATISPQAWHFASAEGQAIYESWRDAYVETDAALAAEHFDAAGFVDADGDGFRDLPSGAALQLVLDLGDWGGGGVQAATEIYAANLEDVGVNVLINDLRGQPDWDLRQTQGLYMLRNMHASELDLWTYPDWVFPLRDNRSWPLEGKYRATGGEEGWEPQPGTTYAYELQGLYDKGLATADIDERHQIIYEAIQIHIDHGPFMIGGTGDQAMPVVVRNGFMGIPDLVILGPWAPGSPGNLNPEQFWMQEDLRMESMGQ